MKLFSEPCYDLNELTNYNMHIHTTFSRCAKPEMRVEAIVREAERSGMRVIALTDHFGDDGDPILEQNASLRREVEATGTKLRVLIGAELTATGIGKYTDTNEENAAMEYRLYACNHLHDNWDHPEDESPRGYAVFFMDIVRSIVLLGRADAIAHPLIGRFTEFDDPKVVTNAITDNELGDLMTLMRERDVVWEINCGATLGYPEFSKRYWNIGREVGVTFHYGGDAHKLIGIDAKSELARLKEVLR